MNKLRFALLKFAAVWALALAANLAFAVPYTQFVVFGDSLSDPGNDFRITTTRDPSRPFPPPPYFNGHFSNGLTAAEYVALRSGLPTQNFAQGGATTGLLNIDDGRCIPDRACGPGTYQLDPGLLSGMQTQVNGFLAGGPAEIGTTLFFLQGGANDFFTNNPAIIGQIVPNLFAHVNALLGAGARHIALSNVPNIARTPFGLSLPDDQRAVLQATLAQVNDAIAQIWANPALAGIIIPVDSFGLIDEVLNDPGAFGFDNPSLPCIALPSCDGAVFFDGVHPTTALHAIAAERILAAVGIAEPGAIALLLIGALGLLVRPRTVLVA